MKFPVYTRTIGDLTAWGGVDPKDPRQWAGGRGGEMVKTLIRWLKSLLGYPMPPRPEQVGEALVTMREARDCHVAAIATACGVSYEAAHKAIGHRNLPSFLESPLLSNPIVAVNSLKRLGRSPMLIGLTALLNGSATSGKALVLLHDPDSPFLSQHWVVWFGRSVDGTHRLAWGNSQEFVLKSDAEMIDLVTKGWPNCIIEAR